MRSIDELREDLHRCNKMMLKLHDLPQPVIAQVHGVATAAGCQLVAACDLGRQPKPERASLHPA